MAALRSNPSTQGVQVGNNSYKLSIFADDLLIYVFNSRIAFPNTLHELEQFGLYSNFKVNVAKSCCLNITLSIMEKEMLENNFPFQWKLQSLKYLGMNIAPLEEKMYELNYLPRLNSTISRLQFRAKGKHSWLGRMAIYMMDILPCFLYLYQTLPIALPLAFFQSLRFSLLRYLWLNSSSRLRYYILVKRKTEEEQVYRI